MINDKLISYVCIYPYFLHWYNIIRVDKSSIFRVKYPEKPETRSSGTGRVGLAFKIRVFSGQKPRKKVENSIGATLEFSTFLQALV